jgi:hypothetical protein
VTSATPTTYCAPCISDLALVREAVTSVAGTASCMAHAVLLTHSSDDPGRRRQRLDALRDLATSKAETADPAEQVKLELLVQEYGLAGAMDMGGPARRGPQPQGGGAPGERRPKSRRGRGRGEGGERPERPAGDRPERPAGDRPPREPREGRGQQRPAEGETAPVTPAPGPAGEGAQETPPVTSAPVTSAPDSSAPEPSAPVTSAPEPAPESAATPAAHSTPVPPTSDPDA